MVKLNVAVLLYVNDAVLLSDDPDLLQGALNRISNVTEIIRLRVNADRTKVMIFEKHGGNRNCAGFRLTE